MVGCVPLVCMVPTSATACHLTLERTVGSLSVGVTPAPVSMVVGALMSVTAVTTSVSVEEAILETAVNMRSIL